MIYDIWYMYVTPSLGNLSWPLIFPLFFRLGISLFVRKKLNSEISPTGPPQRYPWPFTNSFCFGIVWVKGEVDGVSSDGQCGQNHWCPRRHWHYCRKLNVKVGITWVKGGTIRSYGNLRGLSHHPLPQCHVPKPPENHKAVWSGIITGSWWLIGGPPVDSHDIRGLLRDNDGFHNPLMIVPLFFQEIGDWWNITHNTHRIHVTIVYFYCTDPWMVDFYGMN